HLPEIDMAALHGAQPRIRELSLAPQRGQARRVVAEGVGAAPRRRRDIEQRAVRIEYAGFDAGQRLHRRRDTTRGSTRDGRRDAHDVAAAPTDSSNATLPRPPSAQMLTIARAPASRAAISLTACDRMRAPVAPNGWPSATLPPLGLTRSGGNAPSVASTPARSRRNCGSSSALMWNATCAANASWISHRSISAYVSPCRARSRGIANAG